MTLGDGSGYSDAARALLAKRAALARPEAPQSIGRAPLSFPQLTQFFFAHLQPRSAVFNLPKILTLRGRVDEPALRGALQRVVERHAALRTVFQLDGAEPVQLVQAPRPVEFALHDLRSHERGDIAQATSTLLEAAASRPFDLAHDQLMRALLLRTGTEDWTLQVVFHHIAFDGWSTAVFLRELEQAYISTLTGTPARLAPLPIQVPEMAAWQRAQLKTDAFEADRKFWQARLDGLAAPELPLDYSTAALAAHRGAHLERALPAGLWEAVVSCARDHGSTPFSVAVAAWGVLTARRCGQQQCLLGVTIAGRTRAEWEPLIGNFVNVLPLAIDLDNARTFSDLIAQVRQRSAEAFAHQHFPFQQLASAVSPSLHPGLQPLFPVLFNFRNYPAHTLQSLPDLEVAGPAMPQLGSVAPLDAGISPDGQGALLVLDFDPDQIAPETAERWLEAYQEILVAAVTTPGSAVMQLPVMSEAEREQIAAWNRTERSRDPTATLSSMFARQARLTPERLAVSSATESWTYRELAAHADRIARVLRARGIGPGSLVGIAMERCNALVAAMVGVVSAGAGYMPIDASQPRQRIEGMLEDAGVTLLISGPGGRSDLDGSRWQAVPWNTPAAPTVTRTADDNVAARPDDAAYILFTSGSTGRPKGAVVTHSAIVNHLEWMQADLPLTNDDRVLQQTSISFDASIWEFWAPLFIGGPIILATPADVRDPGLLVDLIIQQSISVIQIVPTMLRAMIDTGRLGSATSLRRVCCGGEAMTPDLITAFRRVQHAELVNLYGATETTIDATWWVVSHDAPSGPVPIGRPIANVRAHVLDANGEPVPIGTWGELCVAGDAVARGYVNRPELTRERFVPDRFGRTPERLMYRTGDRARWRRDGLLECSGRLDHQIKLRGHRIELEEIESALSAEPDVVIAAVVVTPVAGSESLVGYVQVTAGATFDPGSLRNALRQRLPEVMVPTAIVLLPEFPLMPSGKIDRKALARLPVTVTSDDAEAPDDVARTTMEFTLADIWRRVLDVRHVGLDDDFFDLGGHSLLAVRMVNELEDATGFALPIATLFNASSIRKLVPEVRAQRDAAHEPGIRTVQEGTPERTPFFMLTGDWTGGGFYCRGLAAALDPAQPFHAIPPVLPNGDLRLATIEGMAAAHLNDVRARQPHGPYRLGGYCIGGLVAYEMARQLSDAGEQVELLLLVDASAPQVQNPAIHLGARALSRLLARTPEQRLDLLAHYRHRARQIAELRPLHRIGMMFGYPARLVRRLWQGPDRTDRELHTGAIVDAATQFHSRAQGAYRHGVYRGRVDVVRSLRVEWSTDRQHRQWRSVAPRLAWYEVPAGHSEVVFTHLPALLRDHLERVDRDIAATAAP